MKIRNLVLTIISVACLFLSGCKGATPDKPMLADSYSFCAEISVGDNSFTINAQKNSSVWDFVFVLPAELEGMEVSLNDSEVTTSYAGLMSVCDRADFSNSNVCAITARVMDYIKSTTKLNITSSSNQIVATGVLDGSDIRVEYDDNSVLHKITLGQNISLDISQFDEKE